MERGAAIIYDNRDGQPEVVASLAENYQDAVVQAFNRADDECKRRNTEEGWTRFVPLWMRGNQ